MCESNQPLGIDDGDERHPSQLEEIDLLPVAQCNPVIWIGQPDKWNALSAPIQSKGNRTIGTNREHLGVASRELVVVIP